jgi:hypothetical protein
MEVLAVAEHLEMETFALITGVSVRDRGEQRRGRRQQIG